MSFCLMQGVKMSVSTKRSLIILAVSLAVVLMANACYPLVLPPASPEPTAVTGQGDLAPTVAPPAAPVTSTLTLDQLKNGAYVSEQALGGKATLVNGKFEVSTGTGAMQKVTVVLAEPAATGDLDGDGVADAAIILAASTGGAGVFIDLHAVLNDGGKPTDAAFALLGDRVQVKSLAIQNGAIIVDLMTHGPKDGRCCPTMEVVQTYKLQGNSLILLSIVQKPTIRLSK